MAVQIGVFLVNVVANCGVIDECRRQVMQIDVTDKS